MLAVDPEGRATRRQHTQPRGPLQELADNRRGPKKLLEVVEQQEQLTVAQGVPKLIVAHIEHLSDRRPDERGVDEGCQPDEPDSLGEAVSQLVRRPQRDASLAGTAGAGQRDEASVAAQQVGHGVDLGSPTDERGRRRWQVTTETQGFRLDVERRVLQQDRSLEGLQLGTGLEAELVERFAHLAVRRQRLGLPARPVKREHLQPTQPFPQRVLLEQRLELPEIRYPTQRERAFRPFLEYPEAKLLEPTNLRRNSLRVEPWERRAAPEREPLLERLERQLLSTRFAKRPRLFDQPLELVGVHVLDLEAVAAVSALDRETRLPQLGDVDLERMARTRRRAVLPKSVHQAMVRDGQAASENQAGEQHPLFGTAAKRCPLHLQRPEQSDPHSPSSRATRAATSVARSTAASSVGSRPACQCARSSASLSSFLSPVTAS